MRNRSEQNATTPKELLTGFKAKVALGALKDEATLTELATRFDGHASQIMQWKTPLVAQAAAVFATEGGPRAAPNPVDVKALHAKIGQQALEIVFLAGALGRRPGSSAKR